MSLPAARTFLRTATLTSRQCSRAARFSASTTANARLSSLGAQLSHSKSPLNYGQSAKMSTSVSKTMKGVLCNTVGGPEVLEYKTDLPVPTPKDGEVLVHNSLTGINYIDTYFRTGLYPAPKPEILGREAVGKIVALGPGETKYGLKVGDRVVYLGTSAYAEYTSPNEEKVVKVPDGITDEDAAAGLLQGLTVITLVEEAYKVKKGDTAMVHAAAGGVGLIMVQVLKKIGAKIVATAGGEQKGKLAKEAGADVVIDYKKEGVDWVKEAMAVTDGKGFDVVFDSVGKDTFDGSLEVVKRKGTLVCFGNASGPVPPFSLARLAGKNAKICRPTLFNYIFTREEFEKYVDEWFRMLTGPDKLNIKVHKVYPLADAAQAQTDLEARKTSGKLLLKP